MSSMILTHGWSYAYGVIEDPELESGIHSAKKMILSFKTAKSINNNNQTDLKYIKKHAPLKCGLHDLDLATTLYGV